MLKSLWRDVRASLNRIFAIVVKEFAVTFGDKGSRMVLIAPVFLQAILFGYGATFNLERVPWVLLDESHSSASAEIVRGITGNGIFDLKRNAVSLADFEKSIDSSEALVGVYFSNDFDRKGEMMVVSDARNSTTAGIAYGYISSIATQVNAKHGGGLAVEVRDRARWNENGITRYTIVPGLIPVLALIQVLLLAGLSVSREREDGSFDMMLMTPADSIEILIGKAVMPTLIACGQAFLIFAIGFLWFELPFKGSFLLLGLVIFGYLVRASSSLKTKRLCFPVLLVFPAHGYNTRTYPCIQRLHPDNFLNMKTLHLKIWQPVLKYQTLGIHTLDTF